MPGGGAYSGALRPASKTTEQNSAGKDLPEYLKQKLKARGILKDQTSVRETAGHVNVRPSFLKRFSLPFLLIYYCNCKSALPFTYNDAWLMPKDMDMQVLESHSTVPTSIKLPFGWVSK